MAWPFPLRPEVFGRLDESDAEKLLPESIDRHSCRQRMIRHHQPPGQTQAIVRVLARHRRQRLRRPRLNFFAQFVIFTSKQNVRCPRCDHLAQHHRRRDGAHHLITLPFQFLQRVECRFGLFGTKSIQQELLQLFLFVR